jgi:hypothetical protein
VSGKQRGGQSRQAQLRAALGEAGYRQLQQEIGRAGGIARQLQLRSTLGEEGYAGYQRDLYHLAVSKHGTAKMHAILTRAHERRRHWRLANPTPAEALLHWLALEAGFTLHADLTGEFEWTRYRNTPARWLWCLRDALIEGRVLGYACDLLLPVHAIAIEVIGGVHALTPERNATRLAALRNEGLTVITLSNEQVYEATASALFADFLEARYAA